MSLIFFWGGITRSGFDWVRNWQLARSASEVDAVIVDIDPRNHCRVIYEFEVDGERYQRKGSGGCDARIGDKIHVYYLPREPEFSTTKTPGWDLVFVIYAPMIMSAFVGLIVVAWASRPGK